MVLHLDLNSLPVENHPSEGTSAACHPCHTTGPQQGSCTQPSPLIDAEELEDEVVTLSSSIDFSMVSPSCFTFHIFVYYWPSLPWIGNSFTSHGCGIIFSIMSFFD